MERLFAHGVRFVVCVAFFSTALGGVSSANALPRRLCSPNICQDKKLIPRPMRKFFPKDAGLISVRPRVAAREFFPWDSTRPLPAILVPGDRDITNNCYQNALGVVKCTENVQYTGCPKDIEMVTTLPDGSKALSSCELQCQPDKPDPYTGLCDCEPVNCRVL